MRAISMGVMLTVLTVSPLPARASGPGGGAPIAVDASGRGPTAFRRVFGASDDDAAWMRGALRPGETIVALRSERLEATGREVIRALVLDPRTLKIREVTRDVYYGIPVDYQVLRAEALDAWHARHGAAHPDLVETLAQADSEPVDVAIEVEHEGDLEAVHAEVAARGGEILDVQPTVVVARVAPDLARAIGRMPHVATVAPYEAPSLLSLGIASDLWQSSLAGAHNVGYGKTPVAIWEPKACVLHSHNDFASVTWSPYARANCDPREIQYPVIGHSTQVAGVLAAKRATGTVGLFRGTLFEVNTGDAAAETTMWEKAAFVNASFTIGQFNGKTIDEQVYKRGTFVFNGAGNDSQPARCWAYNSLCVGGYDVGGTYTNPTYRSYGDDLPVNGASTTNNPAHGREGPHVLGPWSAKTTADAANASAYVYAGGTSIATPAITGLAGLLLAYDEATMMNRLTRKPALMRAVLMASAQAHKIPDKGLTVPRFSDTIDDRMGVGAPHGARAKAILDGMSLRYSKATPKTLGLAGASFSVAANERVRVVLAWDQCPGYNSTDPQLTVDLNLAVVAPGYPSAVVHTNPSLVDNWEVVEFFTGKAGTVTVAVSASRFGACAADGNTQVVPMAIAWTKEPALLMTM
jgi:hypothetical protein